MNFSGESVNRSETARPAVLLAVNVGMPKDVAWQGRTVYTGTWKQPVDGPVMARRLNLDGDGQGDTAGHGGEQRAVMVYQIDSYRYWEMYFGRSDFTYGQFGENLTVDGMPDDQVCIGDRYRIGEAEFEVTQPRVTCYRVGLRLGEPDMAALLVSHHRPGFYMRVITEGRIQAGDRIVKTRTGPEALSVTETDALLYLPGRDRTKILAALKIPALSPGWQESFREMRDSGDGSPAGAAPPPVHLAWDGWRDLLVTRVVPEVAGVTSIYLTPADGSPLPQPRGGQYLTLRIPGAGTPAPIRTYSLSSPPDANPWRISVKQEPHGQASTYLNNRLRPGDVLAAAAPRGEFVLDESGGSLVLVSAGIGITPVLAMLHELVAHKSNRQVWWIHSAHGPGDQPLAAEAQSLVEALPRARFHLAYTAATTASVAEHISVGRLTAAVMAGFGLPGDCDAYICGPQSFMDGMESALGSLGIDPSHIHIERFGALASINPGVTGQAARRPHQPPGPAGTGPLVTFARSGISAPFPDSGPTLLEFAESCDVPTRWSCRTGVCHTCITPLLSGDVRYSPSPVDAPAAGQALICCSRPETEVVLDM